MRLISIGDKVGLGTYRLHSRFRRAVNFTDGRRLVTLVTPDVGAGPVNIVVLDLTPFGAASNASPGSPHVKLPQPPLSPLPLLHRAPPRGGCDNLRVDRYSVVFADRRFLLNGAQSYASLLHIEKETSGQVFRKNLENVEKFLISKAHPKSLAFLLDAKRERNFRTAFEQAFVRQIKMGAAQVFSVAGIRRLAGCGFGLTPSGDDFIAGMLIGLNVLQQLQGRSNRRLVQALYRAAKGKNPFSNSLLRLARDGRVNEKMQMLISALSCHEDAQVKERAREVMAAGKTSGADLLTGLVMAVKNGALESWSVGVLEKRKKCSSHHSMTPVLHYSMAPGDIS